MKSEDDLNAYLTKQMKEIRPHVGVLKLAQKYHIGVADFLVTMKGKAALIESKLIREMPKRTGAVLKHHFEPEQLSFLKRFSLSETPVWGLIGLAINRLEVMWLLPLESIPSTGNWKKPEFLDLIRTQPVYEFRDVAALVHHATGHGSQATWRGALDPLDVARQLENT